MIAPARYPPAASGAVLFGASSKVGHMNIPKKMGRPKGSPNKIQQAAREVIAMAADELGGVDRIVAWAKEDKINERLFWSSVYPRLLPLSIQGTATMRVEWPVAPPRLERVDVVDAIEIKH